MEPQNIWKEMNVDAEGRPIAAHCLREYRREESVFKRSQSQNAPARLHSWTLGDKDRATLDTHQRIEPEAWHLLLQEVFLDLN